MNEVSKQCDVYLVGHDTPLRLPASRVQTENVDGYVTAYKFFDEHDELVMLVPAERLAAAVFAR